MASAREPGEPPVAETAEVWDQIWRTGECEGVQLVGQERSAGDVRRKEELGKKEESPRWSRDEQKIETGSRLWTKRRGDTIGRSPSPSLALLVWTCGHTQGGHPALTLS